MKVKIPKLLLEAQTAKICETLSTVFKSERLFPAFGKINYTATFSAKELIKIDKTDRMTRFVSFFRSSLNPKVSLFSCPSDMQVKVFESQVLTSLKRKPKNLLDVGRNARPLISDFEAFQEVFRSETTYTELSALLNNEQNLALLVQWKGKKVPHGLILLGHEVGSTKHGRVISTTGKELGLCDRLPKVSGEPKDEQVMAIYIHQALQPLGIGLILGEIGVHGFSRKDDIVEEIKSSISTTFSSPDFIASILLNSFEPPLVTAMKMFTEWFI